MEECTCVCRVCDGAKTIDCKTCDGKGWYRDLPDDYKPGKPGGGIPYKKDCEWCRATGETVCPNCNGKGIVPG